MRVFLAIVVCKLLRFIGKLVGKGSSLPGQYALKICPDVLGRVKLPPLVIAVTGSNGKTSTVEMIAAVLRAAGKDVVYNAEGSNQIEGVTTLILSRSTLTGKVRGDVLLLESDERYARLTFRYFHPTHFVITNLYRDQLTGHPPGHHPGPQRRRPPGLLLRPGPREGEVVRRGALPRGHGGPPGGLRRRCPVPGLPWEDGLRLLPLPPHWLLPL